MPYEHPSVGMECLGLQFTFAVGDRKIEAELPGESLGTRRPTDTAMPIPFTTDLHLAILQGAEEVTGVSITVFYGVSKSSNCMHVYCYLNRLRE